MLYLPSAVCRLPLPRLVLRQRDRPEHDATPMQQRIGRSMVSAGAAAASTTNSYGGGIKGSPALVGGLALSPYS